MVLPKSSPTAGKIDLGGDETDESKLAEKKQDNVAL